MKKLLFILFVSFITSSVYAQPQVVTEASGEKILIGFMEKKDLSGEQGFSWYVPNQQNYTPNAKALERLTAQKDSVHIMVFGGTWCDDTRNILPKFLRLAELAGFPDDRITLIGVDRSKKAIHNLTETLNVYNVPTIIVFKNGKETGRVVEYGKYGLFDKELGEIL